MPASSVIQRFWLRSVTLDPFEKKSLIITGCLHIAFVNVTDLESKGLTGALGHRATQYAYYCHK